jgi:polysaccharide chain length determinant protein (PEP-CTERM system associated)
VQSDAESENAMAAQRELTVQDYIGMLRRRWLLIVLLALLGGVGGFAASRVLPKRFTSQTLVLVQEPGVSADLVKPIVSDDNERLAAMQQQILSRSRLEPLIHQLGLYAEDINSKPIEVLVDRLRSAITITAIQPMAGTGANNLPGFTISVVYKDPRMAQKICTQITSMFLEEHVQERQSQGDQTTEFLGQQLTDAKSRLDQQDARLAEFKRQHIGSLPDQAQTNLNLLTGLNTQLEAATQALARAEQDKSFAESMLAQQDASSKESPEGQSPDTLQQQLTTLQSQLTTLRSKYTYNHPDVIKLTQEIANLKQKITETEQQAPTAATEKPARPAVESAQIQQLRAQIHQYDQVVKDRTQQQEEIQQQIKLYQARVQSTPAVEQEYKEITRDYQTALDFYNDLLKKRDQSAMANDLERSQQGEKFRVLDPANLPNEPSFPKMPLLTGGGFAGGLGLGLALTLLFEMQDTSLRSERDVELALRLPVLVSIPPVGLPAKGAANQPTSMLASGKPTAHASAKV